MKRKVLELNGRDIWVDIPSNPKHKLKELTIEAWVYGKNIRKECGIVSSLGHSAPTFSGYGLYFDSAPGKLRRLTLGLVPSSSTGAIASATSTGAVAANTGWHHVAATWDGQIARFYIDGSEVGSQALPASSINYTPDTGLALGMFQADRPKPIVFEGYLSQVRLWQRARTAEEIKNDMSCLLFAAEEPDLVSYWPLNDGSGSTAVDVGPTGADGQVRLLSTWVDEDVPLKQPELAVAPAGPYDFGTLSETAPPITQAFTVRNTGVCRLRVRSITLDNTADFSLGAITPALPADVHAPVTPPVAPDSLAFEVEAAPRNPGTASAKVRIDYQIPNEKDPRLLDTLTVEIDLRATRAAPVVHRVNAVGARVAHHRSMNALLVDGAGQLWYRPARSVWMLVSGLSDVKAVSGTKSGGGQINQVFALTGDGSLWGLTSITGHRTKVLDGVVDVSAGHNHALALGEDGTVWGFGENMYGQRGGDGDARTWVKVGLEGAARVVAGYFISLALMRDGTLRAWGMNNTYLANRYNMGTFTREPTAVPGLSGIVAIAAAGNKVPTCVAATWSGQVYGWTGVNGNVGERLSQLPTFGFHVRGNPRKVDVDMYEGSEPTAIVLTHDGSVWSWGANRHGQSGRRDALERVDVGVIRGLSSIVDIAHGGTWGIALDGAGGTWEWGGHAFAPQRDVWTPQKTR